VVWRSDTEEWVTIPEKVANLVAKLPEDAGTEVLDFAKFLYWQQQRNGISYIQQDKSCHTFALRRVYGSRDFIG